MKEETIDCSGFHFHCPENRGYVIFDPQSQQENDRLDASQVWQKIIAKRRAEVGHIDSEIGPITAFTQFEQVGWTYTGEGIVVVVAGAITNTGLVSGQWFAVRMKEGAEAELKHDLEIELQHRKARTEQQIAEAKAKPKE